MSSFVEHDNPSAVAGKANTAMPGSTVASPRAAAIGMYSLAALRLVIGWTFLWAFLDKTFGLGYATESANSWLNGGSPTEGFLGFAATGPFQDFYNGIAGDAWADWLFMLGLLGIGVAMLLGVFMRIAAASAAVMYLLMWTVVLPPENNPITDDHIIGALVVIVLAAFSAGDVLGFGHWWKSQPIVQRFPWLT
jgi:thiosulfate dehydrogenase [quinone] large subunit